MNDSITSSRFDKAGLVTATLILAVMALGFVILGVEAATEPYHIDELRQVSYYDRTISGVIESSIGMEQPPLDMVVNSLAQRAIGTGDFRQRAISVTLGVGSIGLVAVLVLLAGLGRWSAVAAAATLALSPTTIGVTAYARPYALPTFLMLAFLTLTVVWLKRGGFAWAFVIVLTAVALLLSRPTEPYLFLVVTPSVLLAWQLVGRQYRWPRVSFVFAAAGAALVLVGRPILQEICGEVDQCRDLSASALSQVSRLWTDAPGTLIDALWQPTLYLVAIVALLSIPRARRALIAEWWFWALVLTTLSATAAFFVLSDAGLTFAGKYTYLYYVVQAFVVAALVRAMTPASRETAGDTVGAVLSGLVVATLLLSMSASTWSLLGTESRLDYAELAATALEEAAGRVIITDYPRGLGQWRPWMYGRGRYYPEDAPFVRAEDVLYDPTILDTSLPPAMLLIGVATFDVEAPFTAIQTPNGTIIFDPDGAPGPESAANLLLAVGKAIGGNRGSTPWLAGAFLGLLSGEIDLGCSEVRQVSAEPSVSTDALALTLTVGWYPETGDICRILSDHSVDS